MLAQSGLCFEKVTWAVYTSYKETRGIAWDQVRGSYRHTVERLGVMATQTELRECIGGLVEK